MMPPATYKPSFRDWGNRGFGPELLPIIPVGATLSPDSTVQAKTIGKTPGLKREKGWVGLVGPWPDKLRATPKLVQEWQKDGAHIGLQARRIIGLDMDVEDETLARAIQDLAFEHLGETPVRWRKKSARRLLPYRLKEGVIIRKRRIEFMASSSHHAIDILGHGQYYNVDGIHPSGELYRWSVKDFKRDDIPEITEEQLNKFVAELPALFDMLGAEIVSSTKAGASGKRKKIGDDSLAAPSPERVLEILKAVKCDAETFPQRDEFVSTLVAIKASLADAADDFYAVVLDWALDYPGAEEAYIEKMWNSFNEASVGWSYLSGWARGKGFTGEAQHDFSDEDLIVTNEKIPTTAIEKAIGRYIWCRGTDDFYDTETHTHLTKDGFNSENTGVADYGKSGVQSATAIFMNTPEARKTHTTTYRVGQPIVVQEGRKLALNMWRPNEDFVPATDVSDADVAIWLNHMQLIFGKPGSLAYEHILNVLGCLTQKRGTKINHAIVIYGVMQGTGKDTCFVPLWRFLGDDNVTNIQPEAVAGAFNDFLCSEVVVINEMINFDKGVVSNRMKPWLAAPPNTITINKKFTHPFAIPNTVNWFIFTNHADAIRLEDTDRRFWVHECLLASPMPEAYYKVLHKFYDTGGDAKVIGWLMQRDISSFSPFATPPMTEAKREMISQTQPAPVRWVRDQFLEGGLFAGRLVLASSEILSAANQDLGAPQAVNPKYVATALRAEGFVTHPHHRVKLDGKARQLWVRDPSGLLGRLSGDKIRERYLSDRRNAEKAA